MRSVIKVILSEIVLVSSQFGAEKKILLSKRSYQKNYTTEIESSNFDLFYQSDDSRSFQLEFDGETFVLE
jgi:uncharacterized protein YllA (UPF0747 family)